ncbi:MAG: DUF1800 domain-containing protein [Gemmatimonadaceae bacterium]|nr:DUF1800 domain-containing protein [Gemmatimonadaceae bacterium]
MSPKNVLHLMAFGCTSLFASAALHAQQAPASAHREQAADQQVLHALNRLAFGPRPGDVQRVRAMGLDQWIDQQLHPERIPDSKAQQAIARYPTFGRQENALLQQYADAQRDRRQIRADRASMSRQDSIALRQRGEQLRGVVTDLQSAKVARAVASERQLQEVMTDFWFNHFNVFIRKGGPQPFYMRSYEQGIRERSFGNFRDLLGFVAKSPAMLFYLDNARSMADSGQPALVSLEMRNRMEAQPRRRGRRMPQQPRQPQPQAQRRRQGLNENYGRELLELHTLGVDGGYTQQDVIEVARALTGWTIRKPQEGGGFIFRPVMHDAAPKTVLGQRLAGGQGIEDGEQVLDIVARHPSTARYIATKLARRFVSDTPSTALVDRAAATFTRTDGDIREVVRTIIDSPEFFSASAYRSKVKSPFEVVVSAARALGAEPDPTPQTAGAIALLGQPLYAHQAPNGYPETGGAWINTGSILNRINFGLAAAAGRLPGVGVATSPFDAQLATAQREQQVDAVVSALLGGSVSPDTRAILLSGDHPMIASGAVERAAQQSQMAEPGESMEPMQQMQPMQPRRAAARNMVMGRPGEIPRLQGLAQIIGLALGSPEFQRR